MKTNPEVRPHAIALLKVMAYANSKEDVSICGQGGVYGNAQLALRGLLEMLFGKDETNAILDRFAEICGGFTIDELEEAIECVQEEAANCCADEAGW